MWRQLLFIGALVVTGGVVAWVGDIVGYRLGKRRVSILGIRPRTTALIIGILSGVLISVVTISVLALASQYVRRALFQQARILENLDRLSQQRTELSEKVQRFRTQARKAQEEASGFQEQAQQARLRVEEVQHRLDGLRIRLDTQQTRLARLQRLYAATQEAKKSLEEAKARLQDDVRFLESQVEVVDAELSRAEEDLARARERVRIEEDRVILHKEQLLHHRETRAIFKAGEELARRAIDTGQPTSMVMRALYDLLAEASDVALAKGAALGDNGRAVRYSFTRENEQEPALWTEEPEHRALTAATQELVERPEKSLAVAVLSKYNALAREQVRVTFQYTENKLVFAEGEVVGTIVADGNADRKQIYKTLMILLTQMAHTAAAEKQMLPRPNSNEYGSMSIDEVFDAIERIKQQHRPVRVEAVVQQDTWTIGPLNLDLRIEPLEPFDVES